jgi:hypothetical protein
MKVMPLAFLLAAAAIGQQPAALTTYHDPNGGISFQYSRAWTVVKKADSYSPTTFSNTPGLPKAVRIIQLYGQGRYAQSDLEGLIFTYVRARGWSEEKCQSLANENRDPDNPVKSPQVIHGTHFTVGRSGDGSAGHGKEATIYTTYRNGTCYAFETDFDTANFEGARDLTPSEMRALDRQLDAIMQSVSFDQP